MPAPTGSQVFVEVYGVTYNSINIYGVTRISLSRRRGILKGFDNNKLRPVASHQVSIQETVTVDTQDAYAMTQLIATTGAHDLVFTWKPAAQNIATNLMASQTVTIKNVVFDGNSINFGSKQISDGSITGEVLETADDTDPVVFA